MYKLLNYSWELLFFTVYHWGLNYRFVFCTWNIKTNIANDDACFLVSQRAGLLLTLGNVAFSMLET